LLPFSRGGTLAFSESGRRLYNAETRRNSSVASSSPLERKITTFPAWNRHSHNEYAQQIQEMPSCRAFRISVRRYAVKSLATTSCAGHSVKGMVPPPSPCPCASSITQYVLMKYTTSAAHLTISGLCDFGFAKFSTKRKSAAGFFDKFFVAKIGNGYFLFIALI